MLDMINGYGEGYNNGIQQIVKKMKKKKMDIKEICQITGLTEEEIEKIN